MQTYSSESPGAGPLKRPPKTTPPAAPRLVPSPRTFWLIACSAAMLSYAVLLFEVALTRVFSVMLSYHYAFAVLSAGMLGLGIGPLVLRKLVRSSAPAVATVGGLVLALLIVGSVTALIHLPDLGRYRFWLSLLVAMLPFVAGGVAIASLFQQHAVRSSWLYGADLVGAALAALTVVPSLDAVGPAGTVALASAAAALGGLGLAVSQARWRAVTGVVFIAVASAFALLAGLRPTIDVPIARDSAKEMHGLLADTDLRATVVESRWSSFGRTDVVRSELRPNQLMVFVDGSAGSVMHRPAGLTEDPREWARLMRAYGGYLPLRLLPESSRQTALVIGAGAGRDVLLARLAGVQQVTAVEVNPDVVDIVRDYRDFNGGLYSGDPHVRVEIAEGRSFVRRATSSFDVILLGLPVAKSSRSVEGYALTENYLFTVEAFGEYLDRLTDGGRLIAVMHHEVEIYRSLALTIGAFASRGVAEQDVMRRIYTVPAQPMPALVVHKHPLSEVEANAVREGLGALGLDRRPFFVPTEPGGVGVATDQRLAQIAAGATTLADLAREATYDLSPVTDDRPFFFDLERGLPAPFGGFAFVLAGGLLCVAVWGVPLLWWRRRDSSVLVHKRLLLVFSLLGTGFMLVEIALFHRIMLFIGQPQKAMTVLLFGLLLGGGAGSLASAGIQRRMAKAGAIACLCVAVAVSLLAALTTRLFAVGASAQVTALVTILPLGFLLGFPFPLAVRLAAALGQHERVASLWGVNGVASVLGAVLAMLVGLAAGFTWALALGAVAYGLVALLFVGLPQAGGTGAETVAP